MHVSRAYAAVAVVLVQTGAGHLIMKSPVPYSRDTLDNSPLSSDGSNYPCKATDAGKAGFYKRDGIDNTWPMGSTQTLSFTGSAVHGGGSCQLALSKDLQPGKSTKWQVILSIEGGCPTKDGNALSEYDFKVPTGIEPGEYSFAWTWISKLAGQPEYYMNCAPVKITKPTTAGAAVKMAASADLPELFVANLAGINSCKTTPGTDPEFPVPGQTVLRPNANAKYAPSSADGAACVPQGATQVSAAAGAAPAPAPAPAVGSSSSEPANATLPLPVGGASAASPPLSVPSSSSSAPARSGSPSSLVVKPINMLTSSSAAPSSSSSAPIFLTAPPPVAAPTTLATSARLPQPATYSPAPPQAAPAAPSAPAAPAAPAAPVAPAVPATGSAMVKLGPCTSEGMFNCDGRLYQQCASGAWTAMQAIPAGTSCTLGQSMGLWARDLRGGARMVGGW